MRAINRCESSAVTVAMATEKSVTPSRENKTMFPREEKKRGEEDERNTLQEEGTSCFSRAVEKVYNSAALRRNSRKEERGGRLEPDLRLSLPCLLSWLVSNPEEIKRGRETERKRSLSMYIIYARTGVRCITIGSRARCTRARETVLFHLHLAPCNPFRCHVPAFKSQTGSLFSSFLPAPIYIHCKS